MLAICVSCAWLLGILVGSKSNLPVAFAFVALVPLAGLFFAPRRKRLLILSGLCIVFFFSGVFFFRWTQPVDRNSDLRSYNNLGVVEIRGHVGSDPEVGPESTRIRLSSAGIKRDSEWLKVSGTALLIVPRYPDYRYGDVLLVKGELQGQPQASAANSNESKYWEYLANHDIYSTLFYPEVDLTGRDQGQRPLHWLYAARNNLSHTLAQLLPEPQASLAQGITLGIRANIPTALKTDFIRTGTAHLLAISGVNLTIIAGILVAFTLRFFGRRHYIYIWLTLVVVWLYTWLTGLEAPVVRAAIMVTFFLAADLLGRQRSAVIALALTAAIMTAVSPKALYDASFQLSFAAMAGLVFLFPLLKSLSETVIDRTIPEGRARTISNTIGDSLGVSVAAVIATLPLTAYYFGLFSWLGPLATLVTMPAMSTIIITSILAGASGLAILPLGQAIAWLAWIPLSYLILAVGVFGAVPVASLQVGTIAPAAVAAYYASMALLIVFYHQHNQLLRFGRRFAQTISGLPLKWALPPLCVIALLAWLVFATMPDNNLHVSFLNVGQGDAILIEKGHRQILVDGGPDPQPVIVEMSKKMPFWDRSLDFLILTHPDADHVGGLVEVLERYRIDKVVSPNLTDDSPLFQAWQTTVHSIPGRLYVAASGQRISLGDGVSLSVLNPSATRPSSAEGGFNSQSVVVRLVMGKISFLLTGDLETEGEEDLITQRADLSSTVLKVGHHGSVSSSSESFLTVANPRIAVISVGKKNPYGHPSKEVTARLTQQLGTENIYRTDERGTIEFITDGDKLWVKTDR